MVRGEELYALTIRLIRLMKIFQISQILQILQKKIIIDNITISNQ